MGARRWATTASSAPAWEPPPGFVSPPARRRAHARRPARRRVRRRRATRAAARRHCRRTARPTTEVYPEPPWRNATAPPAGRPTTGRAEAKISRRAGRCGRATDPGRRPRPASAGCARSPRVGPARHRPPARRRLRRTRSPRSYCDLGELEAEESLDESVRRCGLDPPPAERLGQHRVALEQTFADRVHHVVDVTDDHGDERLELREQRALLRRLDRAEQRLGVTEQRLQVGQRRWVVYLELLQSIFEGRVARLEAGQVLVQAVMSCARRRAERRARRGA